MTSDERQRERLRHFPTLLGRWRGARARMRELTASHQMLTVRLERPGSSGNLHISCSPIHIRSPVTWSNCDIDVALTDEGQWIIKVAAAGVEILAEHVEVKENCSPVYVAI
jgi:hypothetical protein